MTPAEDEPSGPESVYGDQEGNSRLSRAGARLRGRSVRRYVRKHRPGTLMDIGCGYEAPLLRELRPQLQRGIGVDLKISPSARSVPGLTFVEGNIESALPQQEAASVDAIVALSVLEHLWEPQDVVAECHRILRPGGGLLIHVPTWLGRYPLEWLAFSRGLDAAGMDDHKRYFNVSQLWPILVRGGFRPQNIDIGYHTLGCTLLAVATKQ